MPSLFGRCIAVFKKIPHRRYYEILGVAGVVFCILIAASLVSPYRIPVDQQAYVSEDESSQTMGAALRYRAEVLQVHDSAMEVKLLDSERAGQELSAGYTESSLAARAEVGDIVLVTEQPSTDLFFYTDQYRIPSLAVLMAVFVALVLLVGRRRGAASIIGLGVGAIVLAWGIVPLILAGYDAFWVCFGGALLIAVSSVFLSHGFRKRTAISVVCIVAVLMFVAAGSALAIWLTGLSGVDEETTFYVAIADMRIDMRGLLAGGIIIATLGVLDDVITTQVAVVDELYQVNHDISIHSAYRGALSVGSEHIAALVNTLVLAYTGASLPLIIGMMQAAERNNSGWIYALNGESLATEIVRTLVASSALVIAVPVSSLAAAIILKKYQKNATMRVQTKARKVDNESL